MESGQCPIVLYMHNRCLQVPVMNVSILCLSERFSFIEGHSLMQHHDECC